MTAITVFGLPRPQGSMRLHRHPSGNGKEVAKYADTVYEWRGLVTAAVRQQWTGERLDGPVHLDVTFDLPRPKGHLGTGRNEGQLRPSAPLHPDRAPDLDKLLRAIGDSITDAGCVWIDDGQVVTATARKRYIDPSTDCVPGCTIKIEVER